MEASVEFSSVEGVPATALEITLIPVTSSQILKVGHDAATNRLAILFKSGGLYYYSNFPEEKYIEMVESDSVGSYFFRNIKLNTGEYPFVKQ